MYTCRNASCRTIAALDEARMRRTSCSGPGRLGCRQRGCAAVVGPWAMPCAMPPFFAHDIYTAIWPHPHLVLMSAATMSTSNQTPDPPTSNFIPIFNAALDEYKRRTGQDLRTHTFAAAFDACNSPDTILNIFQRQAQAFDRFRKGDEKLMRWLTPTVNVLFTLSGTLGEGIGLV
jgi:hypothetical protein